MEVWDFENDPTNTALGQCFPLGCILSFPCLVGNYFYFDTFRTLKYENTIELTYSRRVGITKDGIVFKQLRTEPMSYDPMNICAACCCAIGRFPEEAHQSTTKIIPIDRVQDIKVEEPAGGTRQIVYLSGCLPSEQGEMIPDVDSRVYISTAGDVGAELEVYGLVAGAHLRDTVIALKNGRPMPPPIEGVEDTGSVGSVGIMPGPKDAGDAVNPMPIYATDNSREGSGCFAPAAMSMAAPGVKDEESLGLLRSIDGKLGELISIQRQIANNH